MCGRPLCNLVAQVLLVLRGDVIVVDLPISLAAPDYRLARIGVPTGIVKRDQFYLDVFPGRRLPETRADRP